MSTRGSAASFAIACAHSLTAIPERFAPSSPSTSWWSWPPPGRGLRADVHNVPHLSLSRAGSGGGCAVAVRDGLDWRGRSYNATGALGGLGCKCADACA
ncbi:Os06g0706500 [Oryza sativa Japonica Group]|uniref:Uncharacterized protein n=2 Tax=Oryza sativa subsp. japonica TaxID=39947 RepID=Q5Z9K9_ORYSJ|nr:hypothetical protein [Oryza sativa Japonica Group]BAD53811.1 hypothetical protein [Oryza sativa Japonica Group]BAS99407.1 Os06g0706500 [Oryza sativa Japonica Group]